MNIIVSIAYIEPNLRRLDVIIDGKPWYQGHINVVSGLKHDFSIGGEHSLSINIDAMPPPDLPENFAKAHGKKDLGHERI